MTNAQFMARHELLISRKRKYDPSQDSPAPVTGEEIRSRISFLKTEKVRLREDIDRMRENINRASKLAFAEVERRAQANAEQLMRQMGLKNGR